MGTPLFFTLPLVFSSSNHSTLLEIHSSKGTSQYGGRYNISGRATRYGLTVWGSNPGGAWFPVSDRTDHEISGLFFRRWRPWCIYIYIHICFQLWVGTESWWVDSLKSKPWTRVDFIGAHGAICQDLPELFGCMLANGRHSTWEWWHMKPT